MEIGDIEQDEQHNQYGNFDHNEFPLFLILL